MSTLIANLTVQAAVAACLFAIAALITAFANWFNTRTRMMEQGLQIADLQRLTAHLATVQEMRANAPTPMIITVPTGTASTTPVPTSTVPASSDTTPTNA